jgi:ABC-2 type transport system ATP-binding protein
MAIQIEDIKRYFGNVKAVDGVSFGFSGGTVCGFIGPNGAGKTTTMRILATVDVPDAGDARVCGHSVIDYPDKVRSRIGFMPDYFGTYTDMTVWEYLDFFARTYGLRGQRRVDRIASVMEFTDLRPLADRGIAGLSKGMKQRLSLGRALVNDPEVLILDEPAAGLDPRARIELLELVRELRDNGKAILISSHILAELAKICDYVVIIDKGKLKLTGTMAEIRESIRSGRFVRPGNGTGGPVGAARKVTVTFLAPLPNAEKLLLEQPGVQGVEITGREAAVQYLGGPEGLSRLLKALVMADLPVVGFKAEEEGLEEVFMAVTDGDLA